MRIKCPWGGYASQLLNLAGTSKLSRVLLQKRCDVAKLTQQKYLSIFARNKYYKNLVVDGQQRILSIMFFFEGYFGHGDTKGKRQIFKLTGLNKKSPFNDKKFTDLSDTEQRKLNGSVLRAINIRQLSPKEEN